MQDEEENNSPESPRWEPLPMEGKVFSKWEMQFRDEDADIIVIADFHGKVTVNPGDTITVLVNYITVGNSILRPDKPFRMDIRTV